MIPDLAVGMIVGAFLCWVVMDCRADAEWWKDRR